ncbi:MAG: SpoIVB peptidase [Lachnospiraceae bacterium]|nr:SpoIVB peptidase [Lachnospiraceae bacterium]
MINHFITKIKQWRAHEKWADRSSQYGTHGPRKQKAFSRYKEIHGETTQEKTKTTQVVAFQRQKNAAQDWQENPQNQQSTIATNTKVEPQQVDWYAKMDMGNESNAFSSDDENAFLKNMSVVELRAVLKNMKSKKRKRRFYRFGVCTVLAASCVSLCVIGYSYLYDKVPSILRFRADTQQLLSLNLPMEGAVVSASGQGEAGWESPQVTIDLNKEVQLTTGSSNRYEMDVKLFGILPFKKVDIQIIDEKELIPVGVTVGIYVKTDGILVVDVGEFRGMDNTSQAPAKYIIQPGDYIQKANGVAVDQREDFISMVENSNGKEIVLTIRRGDELTDVKVTPKQDQGGAYKLGIWLRDDAQGVGTLTFIDSDGNFGALGHGINDVDTSTLMEMNDGTLYKTEIVSIKKGYSGVPGEMTGMIVYSNDRILGDIDSNSLEGIFGVANDKAFGLSDMDPLPIAMKQEIRKGSAQILCNVEGKPKYYDVEITAIHLDHDNVNRGIELRITDEELLAITGGIVQGMSGAPIIQDGKFAGAVTHVLVQDSTRGYGIFIENMLSHAQTVSVP